MTNPLHAIAILASYVGPNAGSEVTPWTVVQDVMQTERLLCGLSADARTSGIDHRDEIEAAVCRMREIFSQLRADITVVFNATPAPSYGHLGIIIPQSPWDADNPLHLSRQIV